MIITELQRQDDIAKSLRRMMSTSAGVVWYFSLTLSVRQDDMNDDEMQKAVDFLTKFAPSGSVST
jgi:hypothetical protein